jgi:hypothetical protein
LDLESWKKTITLINSNLFLPPFVIYFNLCLTLFYVSWHTDTSPDGLMTFGSNSFATHHDFWEPLSWYTSELVVICF